MARSTDGFQPIPNPYIVGNPIDDRNMFFGRQEDFDNIRKRVDSASTGGVLVLCGSRRSGKTSILFQIKNGSLGAGFLPVLIDMQSMTVNNDAEFLKKIGHTIVAACGGTRGEPALVFDDYFYDREHENPFAAFQRFIAAVDRQLADRRLLLMFDEYELFETHIDKNKITLDVLNLLSSWMESKQGVYIIFTGSDKLNDRNQEYWERFLGKAPFHRKISFLSRNDTLALVRQPVRDQVSYEDGLPETIYQLTAGQPFYTQVLCQAIIDHLNETRKYSVTEADVDLAVEEIVENPLPQMIFAWSTLTQVEKLAMAVLAELTRDGGDGVSAAEIHDFLQREGVGYRLKNKMLQESLERLFQGDLLDKDKHDKRFRFKMVLWQRWIQRMHSIWQVVDELNALKRLEHGVIRAGSGSRRVWLLTGLLVICVVGVFLIRSWFDGDDPGKDDPLPSSPPSVSFLSVNSWPAGADISLLGVGRGYTPALLQVEPGQTVTVDIVKAGYLAYVDSFVLADQETFAVDVVLEPRRGRLVVNSRPTDATIWLNGRNSGLKTPRTLEDLDVNVSYDLLIRRTGYLDYTVSDLQLRPEESREITAQLEIMTYPLKVVSVPTGAEVVWNRQPIDITPCVLSDLPFGLAELMLTKVGYDTLRVELNLPVPDNEYQGVLRERPPGLVLVKVIPYADIFIDGDEVAVGLPNKQVSLRAGPHEITLLHPSYETEMIPFMLSGGDTVNVEFNFHDEGRPK